MASAPIPRQLVHFADFEVDLRSRELRRNGARVRLTDQSFQILTMLLENPHELVTRTEIKQRLWANDTFVDFDHSLNNAINRLRDALGDSSDSPRFIETLPRRGYRFIHEVASATGGTCPVAPLALPTPAPQRGAWYRRQTWIVFATVVVITSAFAIYRFREPRASAGIRSLAVLPLVNVSGDPSQDYFADGMTDALITNLAELKSVRVISRTSAMHYKGSREALPQIARELNADAVVEGTISRTGDRMRLNAQLVDARTDRHLWAAAYERDVRDMLALQSELADIISRQVVSRIEPEKKLRPVTRKIDPEALDAYLRGRYAVQHAAFTLDGWSQAREYFNRVIQIDPSHVGAMVGLAETYILDDPATARVLASRALEVDDSLGEAHAIIATVTYGKDWDFAAAEKEFRRAVEVDPNSVPAHDWYGTFLAQTGRFDEGLRELRYAERLDPMAVDAACDVALALYLAHRYDEAIEQVNRVLRLDPNFQMAHRLLMRIYEVREQVPEYISAFEKSPAWFDLTAEQAHTVAERWRVAYAHGGARAFWRERLDFERRRPHRSPGQMFGLARVYARLGDRDGAIFILQDLVNRRHPLLVAWMKCDPQLDPLRGDQRFQNLLTIMGYSQ